MKVLLLTLIALLQVAIWQPASAVEDNTSAELTNTYTLGAGDKLRITVFGEEELSGEFEVDGSGAVSMPLIGEIPAGRASVRTLQKRIVTALADGYLVNPKVSIDVLNYRPFFILGEVEKPASYPYVNGLTVLNAVALAGGYTPRAKKDKIVIRRGEKNNKKEIEVGESARVLPGDIIEVPERFF